MRFTSILFQLIAASNAVAAQRQTVQEAAVDARHMLLQESEGTLLSVYQSGVAPSPHLVGVPIGIMEYFADCSTDGSPTMLMLDIAPATRNYKAGSNLTLSLRDHAYDNPLQHGRMYMVGSLSEITDKKEARRVEKCFLSRHPDAEIVAPGRDVHSSTFYTMNVDSLYYFGGFGNVSYIGFIPMELYKSAKIENTRTPITFQA